MQTIVAFINHRTSRIAAAIQLKESEGDWSGEGSSRDRATMLLRK
jgi:hypothetical protein